jgi:hypothetical protein
MGTMGDTEKQIFELICRQNLVSKSELISKFKARGSLETGLARLMDLGFVSKIESLGTCYVATQKGIRTFEASGIES